MHSAAGSHYAGAAANAPFQGQLTPSPVASSSPASHTGVQLRASLGMASPPRHRRAAELLSGAAASRAGILSTVRLLASVVLLMAPFGSVDLWPKVATTFALALDQRPATADSVLPVYVTLLCSFGAATPLLAAPLCDAAREQPGYGADLPLRALRLTPEGFVAAAGACTLAVSLLLASASHTVVETSVTYGALQGLAAAICHMLPMHYVAHCYKESLGLMAGFASAAYEGGVLLMSQLVSAGLGISALPSQGDAPPVEVVENMEYMLRMLAWAGFGSVSLGALLLPQRDDVLLHARRHGSDLPLNRQYSHYSHLGAVAPGDEQVAVQANLAAAERTALMKLWHFWLLPLMALVMGLCGSLVLDNHRDIARYTLELSVEDIRRDLVWQWHVASSMAGRLLWGLLSDVFGYHTALLGISVSIAALLLSYGFVGSSAIFQIWTCLLSFSYGGNYAAIPAAAVELFGPVLFARAYSVIFAGFCLGAAVAATLADPFVSQIKESRSILFVFAFLCGSANLLVFPVRTLHHQRWSDSAAAAASAAEAEAEKRGKGSPSPRNQIQYSSSKSLQHSMPVIPGGARGVGGSGDGKQSQSGTNSPPPLPSDAPSTISDDLPGAGTDRGLGASADDVYVGGTERQGASGSGLTTLSPQRNVRQPVSPSLTQVGAQFRTASRKSSVSAATFGRMPVQPAPPRGHVPFSTLPAPRTYVRPASPARPQPAGSPAVAAAPAAREPVHRPHHSYFSNSTGSLHAPLQRAANPAWGTGLDDDVP